MRWPAATAWKACRSATLATDVGMSKSGVFAHFGSREDLQLAVLDTGRAALH